MADFTWGANGAQLTPDAISGRRRLAQVLLQQGISNDPFPTGTRGAGLITQGMARVAKALSGSLMENQADAAVAQNAQTSAQDAAGMLGLGGGNATPAAAPAAATDTTAPRGIRNNNPLNIEDGDFAKSQPGYTGSDGRFAQFQTPDHGVAAANALLDSYQRRGLNTVGGIVNRWAPPSDGNNTNAYATNVSRQMGIDPNAPLTPAQRPALIAAMGQQENGQPITSVGAPPAYVAPGAAAGATPATPGVARVQAALQAFSSPYTDAPTKALAAATLSQFTKPKAQPAYKDADGNLMQVGPDGTLHAVIQADKDPTSVKEYRYYTSQIPDGQTPMPYDQWSTAKARAGAANISNNFDPNAGQSYDKIMAEGLAKSHSGLANGVEDAQQRLRDVNGMQGAIDAIQKNGGTTGGMAADQVLSLKKTLNAGANTLGMGQPFDENSLSDAEMMQKLNRQMAGAQAKNAVGSRVTNFDLQNYLAANPGLSLSPTANQRLLGIQAQVEQRNVDVGNQIRNTIGAAMAKGQKLDPQAVQKIITDYDAAHHVKDPISGQDLTQSYALPDLQAPSSNAALEVGHETNLNGIRVKRIQ